MLTLGLLPKIVTIAMFDRALPYAKVGYMPFLCKPIAVKFPLGGVDIFSERGLDIFSVFFLNNERLTRETF